MGPGLGEGNRNLLHCSAVLPPQTNSLHDKQKGGLSSIFMKNTSFYFFHVNKTIYLCLPNLQLRKWLTWCLFLFCQKIPLVPTDIFLPMNKKKECDLSWGGDGEQGLILLNISNLLQISFSSKKFNNDFMFPISSFLSMQLIISTLKDCLEGKYVFFKSLFQGGEEQRERD